MRAVLTNMGSLGDVQPLFALASAMRRAGHRPVLALPPYYRERTETLGFEHVPVGPTMDFAEVDRADVARVLAGERPEAVLRDALSRVKGWLPEMLDALMAACRSADVLVSGHLQPAAQAVHELTRIPFVSVQVNHFGGKRAPAERRTLASVINPFRARYGLAPLEDPLHSDANSSQLALYAMSRHLGLAIADRPAHHVVTGFFFLDEPDWSPDQGLASFLADGPPPVVFSFSSMTHADPETVTGLLVEAVERTGSRALIQRGWSGLARDRRLPPTVHATGYVPHGWLFPRAACVVHHGGAQSSAAVLRAGVPALVVPHVRDQPVWAELVRGAGCARCVIPKAKLSADRLAEGLRATLEDCSCREAARAMGEKIRAERGAETACRHIEELLASMGVVASGRVAPADERLHRERSVRRRGYRERRRARRRPARAGGRALQVEHPSQQPAAKGDDDG